MFFREAKIQDLEKIHDSNLSESENVLANTVHPSADYRQLLVSGGKGWLCEVDGDLMGFALVNVQAHQVLTLFVRPVPESEFISRMLHDMMTSWCFAHEIPNLWLTTASGSRAESFYLKLGWLKTGTEPNGDEKLELKNNLEPLAEYH